MKSTAHSHVLLIILVLFLGVLSIPTIHAQEGFGQALGQRRGLERTLGIRNFGSENDASSQNKSVVNDLSLQPIPSTGPGMQAGFYYNVHVLGEVNRPGIYKVLPSDRVTDVLKYAGGNLPNGSERLIQLKREGRSQSLDIYSYKFSGNLSQNPYLTENDVVFVPVKKGEIQVEGPVNRPGKYEIIKPINLTSAIDMAGGFSVGRSIQDPVHIVRYGNNEKRQVIEVPNNSDLTNFMIQKGDVVVVSHVLTADKTFDFKLNRIPGDNMFYPTSDDNVYVIGAVSLPGAYEFKPNYTFREYVSLAGPVKDAKLHSIRVAHKDGSREPVTRNTIINPGDTIVVPQRYWKAEVAVGWVSNILGLTTNSLLLYDRFKNP